METSFSESQSVFCTSHDLSVIRELLMNGLNLSRVIEMYKERLSDKNIAAISRRLLIEIGSKRDQEGQDGVYDDDDAEGSLGNSKTSRNKHHCEIGIETLQLSPCDLLMGSELLKHHIINLSQSAPADFFDPITSHIMSDPVVISSGFVMDRSTAIDEDSGRLRFSTCPWSREPLNPNVYPAMKLQLQLNEFKSGRVREMMTTADLLLRLWNQRDLRKVMEMAQDFMEAIGPKRHRALAVELAQMGLRMLGSDSFDKSKFSILPPTLLTRQLLMLYALKPKNLVAYLPRKACEMRATVQFLIDYMEFDEAEEWLDCCNQIQDQCRDILAADKEIPVAQMHLDLAKKRGDSRLVPFQRRVYLKFLRDGKTAAAQQFLKREGVNALDLQDLSPCFLGMRVPCKLYTP